MQRAFFCAPFGILSQLCLFKAASIQKLPGSRNDEIKVKIVDQLPKDTVTRTILLF